ncbi:MAG: electron transfer flavoprotein subunit alpha/FixB family protein [Deltaproteobacteria bacterium]|nr:electron transfer flavoprotein subunit alpha/FixB family protein [Deltaproteobacteria bacterium]
MANVLVVAEFAEGKVKKTTHSAVTFARTAATALGGSYSILVLGSSAGSAAEELSKLGAAKVLVAEDASLEHYLAETYAPTVAAVAKDFGVVVAAASAFGKDLLPRVAGKLEAGYAADITEVSASGGTLHYKRPMYAGNAFGVCVIDSAVQVVSVRQSAFAAAEATGAAAPIEKVAVVAAGQAGARIERVKFDQVKNERPELAEASVVVAGGRALKEQFYDLLNPLADAFGAAIGASRAACDNGYCASDLQVGQTGKVVAPGLYFAIGISGAIQHLAGMKSSKVIVSINKDGDAPIFQITDYGLVTDLFKAVPELAEKVRAIKAG